MKKLFLLPVFTLLVITLISSCSAIKDKLNVDIDMSNADVEFTIPIITSTGDATFDDNNVVVNIDSIIKANNAELAVSNIKSVKVKSCTVNMIDGDANNNFSALESCRVLFNSNTNSSVVTVAEITNNPDVEAYSLEIPVTSSLDLKSYFNASSFSYSVAGKARKTTSKEIKCKATIRYTLNVGL